MTEKIARFVAITLSLIIFLFNSTQIYGYIKAPSCINKYDHNSYLKDNETFENVIVNVRDFGAKGDGVSDDTLPLRMAFYYNNIIIPEGTYIVNPDLLIRATPYSRNCAFKLHSNMNVKGIGEVIIKIKDNFSNREKPKYYNLFMSNTDDTNITFENITFDLNGQNNLVAENTDKKVFGLYHTAAFCWSYHPNELTGSVNGLNIIDCNFKNIPGTNAIVLGFYASENQNKLSKNVYIKNCTFTESGFDTSDFTYIYSWAEDVLIEDCYFNGSKAPAKKVTGIAVEIHGSNTIMRNNYIENLHAGILIGDAKRIDVENVSVYNNQIEVSSVGINLWRNALIDYESWLKNINIYNNIICITDGPSYNNIKFGISCSIARNTTDVYVYDNNIKINKTNLKSTGIYFGSTIEGEILNNIFISDNIIKNFTFGISNGDLQKGDIGNIYIYKNKILNFITTQLTTYGIRFIRERENSLNKVTIRENYINNMNYGIYLKGYINTLDYNRSDKTFNSKKDFIQQNLKIKRTL